QIRDTDVVHRCSIEIRGKGNARERGITAITAAIDADARRVGNALVNQPAHAVGDVVLHGQAPLAEAGFPKTSTVARGTAEIHLQDAKSPVGQELNFGVVAPAVASPRSAVRVDDAGQALRV